MSEASKSQIAFARAVVRYALYQSGLNLIPIGWAVWAFGFGMPDDLFWPTLWTALAVYGGGAIYLLTTMLIPAIRKRIAEDKMEKS